jgi:glutamine amidotransferase
MVAIIDYGMGNVLSVQKALNKIGMDSIVTSDKDEISKCSHIILPGVGSFSRAMENLHARNLVTILRDEVKENKKPFLGICLGMQLLADHGYEDGETEGLGFIEGSVKQIPSHDLPIPHIGWNEVSIKRKKYFENVQDHNFYFVHSYYLDAKNESDIAATVIYGCELTAAVQKDNIFGTQFHPEKSQEEGIEILKTFFRVNA